jgi:hypothetical protein|tara:strand:- start:234 stop:455 length:222 start_codon:yes stop_codon:yes gene_type:complete
MTNNKIWLVIEKTTYGDDSSFSVSKTNKDFNEAIKYKVHLEALNDRSNRSYFLASDVETVMNNVISAHNKKVA